ncbi:Iron-binding protein IscA [Candidatus Fokinia solitaria]|uniref:Iron-binding protein IscA n=1 Tax=Candidatus Fokinia solitaria TaxID=1802984 RepID=A0A2U8BS39_9RICK|nr:iron-sulfur cluster assembly accessory protein [Candidatus Fokinia solitaria]AWD33123.1 Iron-binding protein IscA [Candidatus Fokinia solitaria]
MKTSCCSQNVTSNSEVAKNDNLPSSTRKSIINITDSAAGRVRSLLSNKQDAIGLAIGVKKGGCTGLSYTFDYVYSDSSTTYEVVEFGDIKLLIDKKAILYIIGTTLDYKDEKIRSGFVFLNPNAKAKCGCGESFAV